MKRTPPKLALPWILEEDWPQWQAVDQGIPSYEKWVELFEKNLKLAEACGWPYERVSVRPDRFNEWCKTNQRTVGKFDRSLYALELLHTGGGAEAKLPSSKDAKVSAASDVNDPDGSESPTDLPVAVESRA